MEAIKPNFYFDNQTYTSVKSKLKEMFKDKLRVYQKEVDQFDIDVIISVGGDGTLLHASNLFDKRQVPPMITIQQGTLGFLNVYPTKNIFKEMQNISYKISNQQALHVCRHIRLQAIIKNHSSQQPLIFQSLNELVLKKGSSPTPIKFDLYINDKFLTKIYGDGLIFSTPTGSTGYNASAGGPIVQSEMSCIIITPICPLSLSFRPIILPDNIKISIKYDNQQKQFNKSNGITVYSDGQEVSVIDLKESEIIIHKSPYDVLVLHEKINQQDNPFISEWLQKLKKSMNWNSDFKKPQI